MSTVYNIKKWDSLTRVFHVEYYSDLENRWVDLNSVQLSDKTIVSLKINDGPTNKELNYTIFKDSVIVKDYISNDFIKVYINSNEFTLYLRENIENFLFRYFPTCLSLSTQNVLKDTIIIGTCSGHETTNIVPYKNKKTTNITTRFVKPLPILTDEQILEHQAIIIQPDIIYNRRCYDIPKIIDENTAESAFQNLLAEIELSINHNLQYYYNTRLLTFIFNFTEPYTPLSSSCIKPIHKYSDVIRLTRLLNNFLEDLVFNLNNVFIIDYNKIANILGRRNLMHTEIDRHLPYHTPKSSYFNNIYNISSEYIGKKYNARDLNRAVYEYMNYIYKIVTQKDQIKLVIFDLDNTLWDGVATEFIESTNREFWDRHTHTMNIWRDIIQTLKQRGIYVSICSKNNYEFIINNWDKLLPQIPYDSFITPKINYEPKSKNILEIIESVNLTPHSTLFIDDSKLEREEVRQNINDIRIIGKNCIDDFSNACIPYVLYNAPELNRINMNNTKPILGTKENKTNNIKFDKKTFLDSLQIKINGKRLHEQDTNIDRVVELTNKTNQFNTTTIRRTLSDILYFIKQANNSIYYFSVLVTLEGKITDFGIVCVVYICNNHIQQFLMSCRVLGLEIENNILFFIVEELLKQNDAVTAMYKATQINSPCRDLFSNFGFTTTKINGYLRNLNEINTLIQSIDSVKDAEFIFNKDQTPYIDYKLNIDFDTSYYNQSKEVI